MEEQKIIDVRKAVSIARDYFPEIVTREGYYPRLIDGYRLEQTELTEDRKYWLITLGYDVDVSQLEKDRKPNVFYSNREYKRITLDARTGVVNSIEDRNGEDHFV